jgi:molybdopterin-guanine dinucleotide biosynthesis protein A
MAHQRAIVAVLAGGRGTRLGGAKPSLLLAGSPLVCHPLRASRDAGLEAIVVAKRSTKLPELDAPVLYEPDEPSHPLCGVLAALRFAAARPCLEAVLTLACDMPFLTGPVLAWLSGLEGAVMTRVAGRPQPLLARWTVAGAPLVQDALDAGSSLQAALGSLAPAIVGESELSRFGDPARLCFNVNDREDLRATEAWLASATG